MKASFAGQLSASGSTVKNNKFEYGLGGQYIPEFSLDWELDSLRHWDVFVSARMQGSLSFQDFSESETNGKAKAYRVWTRFRGEQYELRLGLQKIDFGSATLLRPMQWFGQIDPRDPLGITNGVYGILGRYYFENNANIWLWALYGNEERKGSEILETRKHYPEFGGRFQFPVPKGEMALSYHFRQADSAPLSLLFSNEKTPEHRLGLDAKWDMVVGFWLEASQVYKTKKLGLLTHQSMLSAGVDYTFGWGNGLNVSSEHMVSNYSERPFSSGRFVQTSALSANYPLGFSDRLQFIHYLNWKSTSLSFFLSYEHQFTHFAGYLMLFSNSESGGPLTEITENAYDLGRYGLRIMLVYNH
ncbi:MAG: hypothetical protein MI784_10365 [Cytophagales bacterium]|nr:hypothetical protein [Cytophagales bacterium]